MCAFEANWEYVSTNTYEIHSSTIDDSHLLLSLSIKWLFSKINMNIRHILCTATHSTAPLASHFSFISTFLFFFLRIQNFETVSLYWWATSYYASIMWIHFAWMLRFYDWIWARACFFTWHIASDKNFGNLNFLIANTISNAELLNVMKWMPLELYVRLIYFDWLKLVDGHFSK